jgi:hypothetical protein
MRKLKLDVDALQVESFEADASASRVGTVRGQHDPFNNDPESTECDGGGFFSIFGTCKPSYTCGTCIGPTFCCPPTWRPTCPDTCLSCPDWECGAGA